MTVDEDGSTIKVLVLDDEKDFLDLCREFIGRERGLEVDYATSPAKALNMLATDDYQVVVSDHNLTGRDGLQFLKAMRSIKSKPFVLITGHGREALAIDALHNGADFYLEKAGNPAGMFEQMLRAIKALGSPVRKITDCLSDPFQVFSAGGVLFISNSGERVMAAASR